tara:strand:+ start:3477 stop:3632 length:156 start_codon:yes stop_codon:yes gene_type:complete
MKFFFAGNIDDFYLCDFCNYKIKKGENYFYFAQTDEVMCHICLKKRRLNDV